MYNQALEEEKRIIIEKKESDDYRMGEIESVFFSYFW
jgi:hypothetical protein